MSSVKSQQEQDEDFLASSDVAIDVDEAFQVEEDVTDGGRRLESRDTRAEPATLQEPKPDEEDFEEPATSNTRWADEPSVPQQFEKHPDTVRGVEPTTVIFDAQDPDQLKELNRIQRASTGEAPTMAIMVNDRQHFEGRWSVYLTYEKIQYQKM